MRTNGEMTMKFELLASPIRIGTCEIKNRVVLPPMHLGFANMDGTPSERLTRYYERRAEGGAGLLITEITRVDDRTGASTFTYGGTEYTITGSGRTGAISGSKASKACHVSRKKDSKSASAFDLKSSKAWDCCVANVSNALSNSLSCAHKGPAKPISRQTTKIFFVFLMSYCYFIITMS